MFSTSFQGTAIELHCCLDNSGAAMNVQLDSQTTFVNTSTGLGSSIVQEPYTAWTALGLDPNTNHTLTVTFVGSFRPTYLYFEYLLIASSPSTYVLALYVYHATEV
jgi:hypothetical protein